MKRAGLLLYYLKDDEVFFRCMIPSDPDYGGKQPQLPKGTIESGDTSKYTAIKECIEEAGLKPSNLIDFEHFKDYPKLSLHLYIGSVRSPEDFGKPHWETGWSGWVNYDKKADTIRRIHRELFDDVYRYLKDK